MGWGSILGAIGAPFTAGVSLAIGAGLDAAGAAISSHGANKAADTQGRAAQQALGFQREVYGDASRNFAPYINTGQNAVRSLSELTARPRPTFGSAAPPPPVNVGGMSQLQARPMAAPGAAGGGLVTVRGPDGSTRQVPQSAAQAFVARGARVVG